MNIKDLKSIGISETEAKVYLATLELGETTIARIAQKAGVKRTTTYLALETLKELALISRIKKGKKTFIYAEDPRGLEKKMEERKQTISKMIPELLSISNLIDKKPIVRYFEGTEGLKEVFKDVLNYSNQEVFAWFPQKINYKNIRADFFDEFYVPERKKKNIWYKALIPNNADMKRRIDEAQKDLMLVKTIPEASFPVDVETLVYGNNKVCLISYEEEIAIVIESKNIFDMMKSTFLLIWNLLPDIQK